jgi:septum formation protein
MNDQPNFYLASASPRRRELLGQLGYRFALLPVDVPERQLADETAEGCARRLALGKARAGAQLLGARPPRPVLGADTVVVLDGQVLGKPADHDESMAMLTRLSGREHRVVTAVAVVDAGREEVRVCATRVWMRAIDGAEVQAYAASGEGSDKAGGYAIQGHAAIFVERIEGSYTGVVGLPLFETAELLGRFGIRCLAAGNDFSLCDAGARSGRG